MRKKGKKIGKTTRLNFWHSCREQKDETKRRESSGDVKMILKSEIAGKVVFLSKYHTLQDSSFTLQNGGGICHCNVGRRARTV